MPIQIQLLRIGELAQKSQVPIKTIRYYEELGLIRAKSRTSGGFRLFTLDVLPRLDFIKRSQCLGLSLQEIGHILKIHDQGELPCAEVRQMLAIKIAEITQRIEELKVLKTQLQLMISEVMPPEWSSRSICPIIQPKDSHA
jgi:DNA-binding transcriptional MerR regulator